MARMRFGYFTLSDNSLGYGPRRNAEELRGDLAAAKRYRDR